MKLKFDYFVVFASMRTGSNFLEANINQFEGLACLGEAFNPNFIGYPQSSDVLGVSLQEREDNPKQLVDAVKASPDLCGFRFFNDHDPRALDLCLNDPRCAKIILTRNPVESFVSWKIARATGQWKLTNATHAKTQTITFDRDEFEAHLDTLHSFQVRLQHALQTSGQTAFYLSYDDLHDVEVMNGIAMFLGLDARLVSLDRKLKKQNPGQLSKKVNNFEEMEQALARLDRFNLHKTPNFEPRRGPVIPTYIAAPKSGLLYMPLRSGPDEVIHDWLAKIDEQDVGSLKKNFTQKTLRQWKRSHPRYLNFSVLCHPIARAHRAFCDRILFDGPGSFPQIRSTLRKVHKLPIPEKAPDRRLGGSYDVADHRKAFLAFLGFLQSNLSAQTSVRVDPAWSSQLTLLQGIAQFNLPDMILREARLAEDLCLLAKRMGFNSSPAIPHETDSYGALLKLIYDERVEKAGRDAYHRDYLAFGFDNWA